MKMSNSVEIFRLKSTPSGPMAPWEAVTTTWRLLGDEEEYVLEIVCRLGRKRKQRRVAIGPKRAGKWIDAIGRSKVSLFPVTMASCDGSCFELRTGDVFGSVSLAWLNLPPEGAEPLEDLTEWLWGFVTPDLGFSEEEFFTIGTCEP